MNPHCSMAMSAEYRSTFASPSLVMVTYPYAWKILVRVDWLIDWLSLTPHRQCLCLLTEENGSKNHNQTNKQINHYHCMNSKTTTMITSDRLINWLIDWLIDWLVYWLKIALRPLKYISFIRRRHHWKFIGLKAVKFMPLLCHYVGALIVTRLLWQVPSVLGFSCDQQARGY